MGFFCLIFFWDCALFCTQTSPEHLAHAGLSASYVVEIHSAIKYFFNKSLPHHHCLFFSEETMMFLNSLFLFLSISSSLSLLPRLQTVHASSPFNIILIRPPDMSLDGLVVAFSLFLLFSFVHFFFRFSLQVDRAFPYCTGQVWGHPFPCLCFESSRPRLA